MAKTFNAGDPLPASDLNTHMLQPTGTRTRIVSGITAFSWAAATSTDITINWGFTFSAAPVVIAVIHVGSFLNLVCYWNSAPGVSSGSLHIVNFNLTSGSYSGNVHWIAIGPP